MNTIRRAERRDMPGILRLLLQVDMVHHTIRPDLFNGPTTKYTEQELRDILADEKTPVFVCVDESGKVLGHCFCIFKQILHDNVMTDVKTLYIDDLCVDEACRGQHVGRALYEYVKRFAKDAGCYNITLNVWAGNDSAQRFYEHCGLAYQKFGMEQVL